MKELAEPVSDKDLLSEVHRQPTLFAVFSRDGRDRTVLWHL